MKKQSLTSLAIASTFAAVALTPVANAADNPFAAKQLSAGYQLAQADTKGKEGKCGEGKCGAEKKSAEKESRSLSISISRPKSICSEVSQVKFLLTAVNRP